MREFYDEAIYILLLLYTANLQVRRTSLNKTWAILNLCLADSPFAEFQHTLFKEEPRAYEARVSSHDQAFPHWLRFATLCAAGTRCL